jgi:regulator of protease activity HflC (stomatin/prohibitin superfamily)
MMPYLIAAAIILLYLLNSIKILKEYERAVVFRLGRVRHDASGPGIILVFRPVDTIVRVSLRQEAMEVPSQDIITRDNVTLKVNAVITLRVIDPVKAVIEVSNYVYQTSQFAQTTLRSVLGEVELEPAHPDHHRRPHVAFRRQSRRRRGQTGRYAGKHAPRHGQAGRG